MLPAGKDVESGGAVVPSPFAITLEQLDALNSERKVEDLVAAGGVEGLAAKLLTSLMEGLPPEPGQKSASQLLRSRSAVVHETTKAGGKKVLSRIASTSPSLREPAHSFIVPTASVSHGQRVAAFGDNVFVEPEQESLLSILWGNLQDPTLVLLMIAASVSVGLGAGIPAQRAEQGWVDGVAIWAAVLVVSLVGAVNDYQKETQFRKLNAAKNVLDVKVVRDGTQRVIRGSELLVGDIVELDMGDKVPADGLYVRGEELHMDESALTGESEHVDKSAAAPFLLSGTTVSDGSARMLVTAVGTHCEWGRVVALTSGDQEETPLQQKLEVMARMIGYGGMAVAGIVFVILIVAFFVNYRNDTSQYSSRGSVDLVNYVLFAITIVVVAVPEGLPLAVTISLAYSVMKMMADNNLVRYLAACETMGGATNICSDKTGTLTQNRMTVIQLWAAGELLPDLPDENTEMSEAVGQAIVENMSVNAKAYLFEEAAAEAALPGVSTGGSAGGATTTQFVGSRTECAMLLLVRHMGIDYNVVRAAVPILKLFPFTSVAKISTAVVPRILLGEDTAAFAPGGGGGDASGGSEPATPSAGSAPGGSSVVPLFKHDVYASRSRENSSLSSGLGGGGGRPPPLALDGGIPDADDAAAGIPPAPPLPLSPSVAHGRRTYVKGAPDWVLALCDAVMTPDGGAAQLDAARRAAIAAVIETMAGAGLRVLCLAHVDSPAFGPLPTEPPSAGLTCDALVGIKDPVRPDVPAAVRTCQRAGIVVRMVTGDALSTASHIAAECGILTRGGEALEGSVFRKLGPAELDALLPKLQVLARSSPEDKFRLVKELKARGEIVAVTGDGTNDAPALKESDVGLSMGKCGTEVAKEASDIVIMDDNFASIVKTVLWGRSVTNNIQKFLVFQLTVNVGALGIAAVAALLSAFNPGRSGTPLNVLELLWVNLVMDALGALALATEDPDPRLLLHRPYGRTDPLITPIMWKHILVQASYQLGLIFAILYGGPQVNGYAYPTEAAFCGTAAGGAAPPPPPSPAGSTSCTDAYNSAYTVADKKINSLVFNAFMWCQIFNQINCRRVFDELNVFENILKSRVFLYVMGISCACQVIFIEAAYLPFQISPESGYEWLFCIGCGVFSLPLAWLTKVLTPGFRFNGKRADLAIADGGPEADLGVADVHVTPLLLAASTNGMESPLKPPAAAAPEGHLGTSRSVGGESEKGMGEAQVKPYSPSSANSRRGMLPAMEERPTRTGDAQVAPAPAEGNGNALREPPV